MDAFHPVRIAQLKLDGNIFLAPVAGYSDCAFRSVCVEHGAMFTCTEMVSSEALVRKNSKTAQLTKRAKNEKSYAVQIFGSNPEIMKEAAAIVRETSECSCIDINCGCPVPKITKTGAGSALLQDAKKLYAVVNAVVQGAKDLPVTIKIRSGWDSDSLVWKEAAACALDAGVSAICMHPRTRAQGYEGKADWNILKELVLFVNGRIPVFGSGDLFTPESALHMIEQTGVDAVMFARGSMGNPFIFAETQELFKTGKYSKVSSQERIKTGFRELDLLIEECGEEKACKDMRKRFCAYTKGIANGGELRNQIVHSSTRADYESVLMPLTY
ncbi:MAG: tRNA dihydrouridine synthase DusB [Treponema sp.]|nr:tRNA dihydrouridine synthase DusB [Treponema sp.]